MQIFNRQRYLYRFAIPLILVVGLFLSGIFFLGEQSDSSRDTSFRLLHGMVMTAGLWLGCVWIVSWLWEKYPWQKNPVKHLILEILLITSYTIAFSSLVYLAQTRIFKEDFGPFNLVYDGFLTILITFFITAIHEAVFFYRQWNLHFSSSVKLKKDNIEANYEALKNQVNPHFLFNSLNSLTGLVDDNKEAVKYITNLSGFLRYLLKSNEKELVRLREEIEIAKKYVELQSARFGDALIITTEIAEQCQEKYLPPLVLQMLIQNCIKHNVVTSDQPLEIRISCQKDTIRVENNLNPKKGVVSTGKGLKNIRDRYSLFSNKHPEILKTDSSFEVKLPLLTVEE